MKCGLHVSCSHAFSSFSAAVPPSFSGVTVAAWTDIRMSVNNRYTVYTCKAVVIQIVSPY